MEEVQNSKSIIVKPKKKRFASTKEQLKEDRNAKNTNRATILSLAIPKDYIKENDLKPIEEVADLDLPELFENFYCNARTKESELYKTGSFKSLRSNLNRYFKEKRGINICTDAAFTNANIMFKSIQVKAKKSGKGSRHSTPVIDDTDLIRIGNYFDIDYMNTPNAYVLRDTIMFYIIYFFCRQGQENLYTMEKEHFAIKFDNGTRYLIQNVDEQDKNHRENCDKPPNQGRMYEQPGT